MPNYIVTMKQTLTERYKTKADDENKALDNVLDGEAEEIPETYDNDTDWEVELDDEQSEDEEG